MRDFFGRPFRRELAIIVGLVVLTAIAYARVGSLKYVYFDDREYVYQNPRVQAGLTHENIVWALETREQANWHPLTWLSHLLDVECFGLDSGRHHLVNLAFHVCNAVLLFLVLRWMTGAVWSSGFVAALFAVHPLHVESVAWVSERKDLLSTFFGLLALAAYVWYARRPQVRRYAAVMVLMALSLMAKPTLVTLPFLLLLLDYWPLARVRWRPAVTAPLPSPLPAPVADPTRVPAKLPRRAPRGTAGAPEATRVAPQPGGNVSWLLLEKTPLLGLSIASSVITCFAQWYGGSMATLERVPLGPRVGNAALAYVRYLYKMVWPLDLGVLYPLRPVSALHATTAEAALLLISLLAAGAAWRGRRYAAVGWFWFLGTLVPTIGLVSVGDHSMADRYSYLPLVGVFIVIAWAATEATSRWPRRAVILAPVAAAVLLACTALTVRQVGFWRNSESLFQHAVAVSPDDYIALNNLGNIRACPALLPRDDQPPPEISAVERKRDAKNYYRRALEIRPGYAEGHSNLGNVLAELGSRNQAIDQYQEALAIDSHRLDTRRSLANTLVERAMHEQATGQPLATLRDATEGIEHYDIVLQALPADVVAHDNLGVALVVLGGALESQGNAAEARVAYEKALRVHPGWPVAVQGLARLRGH